MPRYAFRLSIQPDRVAEYDEAHRHVWPDLLSLFKEAGLRRYSIFRDGTELFLYVEADDFRASWAMIENHPVNLRWQQAMRPFFGEDRSRKGANLELLDEIFFMP